MKGKFFGVVVVLALVMGLMLSISGCKSTSPTTAATATTVPTATNTATPIVSNAFAAGVQSWSIPAPASYNQENALTNLVWDSVNGNTNTASSAGCLSMTGTFDASGNTLHAKGNIELSFSAATDVTGKTYTAWIKVPAGMANGAYHAMIYLKTGAPGYHYCSASDIVIGSTNWIKLQATTAAMAVNTGTTFAAGELAIVSVVGVNFYRDPTTATDSTKDVTAQTILVDDISIK